MRALFFCVARVCVLLCAEALPIARTGEWHNTFKTSYKKTNKKRRNGETGRKNREKQKKIFTVIENSYTSSVKKQPKNNFVK